MNSKFKIIVYFLLIKRNTKCKIKFTFKSLFGPIFFFISKTNLIQVKNGILIK